MDDENTSELPQDILNKITVCLTNNPNKLASIMMFLNDKDATQATRCLKLLRSVFTNDVAFNQVVHKLAEDAQILENDRNYIRFMADMWNHYLTPNENKNVETTANKIKKCVGNLVKGADALEKAYKFLGKNKQKKNAL